MLLAKSWQEHPGAKNPNRFALREIPSRTPRLLRALARGVYIHQNYLNQPVLFVRRGYPLFGACLLALMASASAVRADEQQLFACIKKYTTLGISADAALAQCQKTSVVGCVQKLLQSKFVASSIKFVSGDDPTAKPTEKGYLIDIGNSESRWLEGKQWQEKGCAAFTQGPYKRQSDNNSTFWNTQRSYEWFRQGWCPNSSIELEQPYSLEEAKLRCELGIVNTTPATPAPPSTGPRTGN